MNRNRRRLLGCVPGLLAVHPAVAAFGPTPAQTPGPFYPDKPPLDQDNDLVQVAGHPRLARGEITELQGRVLGPEGGPLSGLRIEIWQCDANGYYHHAGDRDGGRDPGFQGFGHAVTDRDGRYRFRTIRPVAYPGRTPHIHVAVHHGNGRAFTTQLYVRGDPRNENDFIYKRIPPALRERVTASFSAVSGGATAFNAHFDIVLGVTPGG